MDSFLSRKRPSEVLKPKQTCQISVQQEEDSTELKLAILASLSSVDDSDVLLEALLAADGSVEVAAEALNGQTRNSPRKKKICASGIGYQSSLHNFRTTTSEAPLVKQLTQKGKTVHLYAAEDIARHTPCSIIHNFLSPEIANALLDELLTEAPSFGKEVFNLFDKTVTSPHTMCFYVDEWDEAERQKTEYVYNGSHIADVRKSPAQMRKVSAIVAEAVNGEIQKRIQSHYPGQQKLKYQSPKPWVPNTAFVNCYDGGKESVGYHSDQLTYLGPRAVIGSLSLGVAREFRVRKVVPKDAGVDSNDAAAKKLDDARADTEGQIAIHLPHNSLLVMHAEMQEEWKHSKQRLISITASTSELYRYRTSASNRSTPYSKE